MQEVQVTLPIGTVVRGHYVIKNLLGKGNSSAVYLVEDQRIRDAQDNRFALKEIIHPHKEERNQLVFESALLREHRHRALPCVYHIPNDEQHDRVYLLMEYIEGPNLETLRQQQPEKRFSWLEVITMVAPIIRAVVYLHYSQPPLIHRNIKPTNIIVSKAHVGAVLVDFGSTQPYELDLSVVAIRSFASAYRSPEYYHGGSKAQTDIYGLGATLYTLVTGMVPADAHSRLTQLGNGEIDPLEPVNEVIPTIPVLVAETIQRAMAIDANDRFSSVEEFWEACWMVALNPTPMVQPISSELPITDASGLRSMPSDSSYMPVVALHESVVEDAVTSSQEQTQTEHQSSGNVGEPDSAVAYFQEESPQVEDEATDNDGDSELAARAFQLVAQVEGERSGPDTDLHLPVTPWQRLPQAARPRVSIVRKLVVLLSLLILLIGLGIGADAWYHTVGHPAVIRTTTPISSVPSATNTQTVRSTPSPASTIAGAYTGTIYDLSLNVSTSMSLTGVQQSHGTMSGYLTLGPKLQGSGPFSGTIDAEQHFRFIVTDSAGHALLFFEGAMQTATSLSGDYYQCGQAQGDSCSRAVGGGYGIWSVVIAVF